MEIIREKQDLTYLKWSHIRSSSGTAGTFLKSSAEINGKKVYYKLSNFDPAKGVIGHECINEIIVERLLNVLGVEHLEYKLLHADIEIEGRIYETWLCESEDFKKRGESKIAIDDYYRISAQAGESHYDFCVRQGFGDYIDRVIAVDYIILNRDRHGANLEILRNARAHTVRPAPLFDHGLSLMFSCLSDEEALAFDITEDKKCQNFIGTYSCLENLSLIRDKKRVFTKVLEKSDRNYIFSDMEGIMSKTFQDCLWNMIYKRYTTYENL